MRLRAALVAAALVCALVPTTAVAGSGDSPSLATTSRSASTTAPEQATGLIVSTAGLLPASLLESISDLLGLKILGQTPMGDSRVALRFDGVLPASLVRLLSPLLSALPGIGLVSPDLTATTDSVPNDTYFSRQTNLWSPESVPVTSDSIGEEPTEVPEHVPTYDISAPTMWDATRGSKSVVVAVIDGGIVAHPDLAKQTVPGYDMVADPRYSKDGGGRDSNAADPGNGSDGKRCTAAPSSWHGTHVAGIIAARRNNGIGISGIAPDVLLQPVRVIGQCRAVMSDVVAGIRWASGGSVPGVPRNRTPADVINLSLSSTVTNRTCPVEYQKVIDEARRRDVVVVASAGNQSERVETRTPANCKGVLSVGATAPDGSPTTYTNAGFAIGMMAPGGEDPRVGAGIWSTIDSGTKGPRRSTYGQKAGTSMAAPAVSAAAALVRSLGSFTNDQVVDVLKQAAARPPRFERYYTCLSTNKVTGEEQTVCGAGILNLEAIPAPVGKPAITGGSSIGSTLSFTPGRWNGQPESVTYQWLREGKAISAETPDPSSYTLTAADLGRTLSVRATAHTPGYPDFSGLSAAKVVPRARSSVALRLSSHRARAKRKAPVAYVTVAATLGQSPAGSIRVYVHGRHVKSVKLSGGKVRVRIPSIRKTGRHSVRVRYGGTSRVSARWSKTLVVRVTK